MSTTVTSPNLVREGTLNALRALTSRGTTAWPEPTLSVGRQIGKFGKELCWEAVGPARDAFKRMCPRIKEHLESGVETVSSWVTWSMYMIGKTPELACPTILFCCEVSAHRKLVRNVIKESGILDKYPGIKTGHASRPPDFNQLVRVAEASDNDQRSALVIEGLVEPHGSPCGMELTINAGSREPQTSSATVGGVIQLGERFYYLTAEHAFRFAGEEDAYDRLSDSDTDSTLSIDEDIFSDVTDDGNDPDRAALAKLDISDAQQSELPRIRPDFQENVKQKQLRVIEETIRLPTIAICSADDPATNLDYILIEVSKVTHQAPNSIEYDGKEISVQNIVEDGPKDVKILAITSRGILSGRLSGTGMFTSLPGTDTYQEVYYVQLDYPLEIGDCGSWVIHANTGDLFGHIVAGSPETGAALIIPAQLTFDDIENRTQIRPELPVVPIQPSPEYVQTKLDRKTPREIESRLRQLTQNDIAWTRDFTARFVELMRKRHKQSIRDRANDRANETTIIVQGSSSKDLAPPSYHQAMKDTSLRDRFRRRFPLIPEPPAEGDKEAQKFRNLLISLSYMPLLYEDEGLQELALDTMPLDEIYVKASEKESAYAQNTQASSGKDPHWNFMECSIIAMMDWFKNRFFTWVNNPPCSECQSATVAVGMGTPTAEESEFGALRVELYRCSNPTCLSFERFPRYRDPRMLMRTRRGRVGEWANCFALFCRALGARVRWVWTATDHVFVEVYSVSQRRWVHADPCENAFDQPRLYSEGWGKALIYVIAFSVDGATDVTRRYVRSVSLFRERPRARCSEEVLVHILRQVTAMRRTSLGDEELARLQKEDVHEQKELNTYMVSRLTYEFVSKWGQDRAGAAQRSDAKRQEAEEVPELECPQTREAQ
ncbi:peptidase (PNG1) [Cordyceps fumosorosea ARSEF 2679]|uniref:Peptidase (PNG1) n=1 Tax=Cordyceps fumosorosea (strain ARSEF 2679) TaxID=1081104 RepID=A0A162LNW3_CORFA|nr:peptidase (PNG1) [Cordyceps fumosorosea ARSEF 2679]OAA73484.1 peptidase (PNG1) [Cordyceps fumosorosea ARSEF 2679]